MSTARLRPTDGNIASASFLFIDIHQLVLHQRHVVVLVHLEIGRLSHLNPAPLVYCQPHGALEHVNLGVAEDHCCIWLQKVNCPQSPQKRKARLDCNQPTNNDGAIFHRFHAGNLIEKTPGLVQSVIN